MADLAFEPLTSSRWSDFESIMADSRGCSGCWCMWWKLKRKDFDARKGAANKRAMKRLVDAGEVPGILALDGDAAVGWCAIEPRSSYPLLARSPLTKPVDDTPVWSITCLFVHPDHRGTGMTTELVRAAVSHVESSGGQVVEAYAVEPHAGEEMPAGWISTGVPSVFQRCGFTEVARRPSTRDRLIYRYEIA